MNANATPAQAQETQVLVPIRDAASVTVGQKLPEVTKTRGSNYTPKYLTKARLKKRAKRKAQNLARCVMRFYGKPHVWTTLGNSLYRGFFKKLL